MQACMRLQKLFDISDVAQERHGGVHAALSQQMLRAEQACDAALEP